MYKNGINWLKTRINPDASINPEGNTRTGLGQEKGRNDNIKTINYGSICNALYWWALKEKNDSLGSLCEKIWNQRKK